MRKEIATIVCQQQQTNKQTATNNHSKFFQCTNNNIVGSSTPSSGSSAEVLNHINLILLYVQEVKNTLFCGFSGVLGKTTPRLSFELTKLSVALAVLSFGAI